MWLAFRISLVEQLCKTAQSKTTQGVAGCLDQFSSAIVGVEAPVKEGGKAASLPPLASREELNQQGTHLQTHPRQRQQWSPSPASLSPTLRPADVSSSYTSAASDESLEEASEQLQAAAEPAAPQLPASNAGLLPILVLTRKQRVVRMQQSCVREVIATYSPNGHAKTVACSRLALMNATGGLWLHDDEWLTEAYGAAQQVRGALRQPLTRQHSPTGLARLRTIPSRMP
jgi:hypothetical protein